MAGLICLCLATLSIPLIYVISYLYIIPLLLCYIIFLWPHRAFLVEYNGIGPRLKAIVALSMTSYVWALAGLYGIIKGLTMSRNA